MITAYDYGIFSIDAHYLRPQLAAVHLILENGRAALVDTGINASVPHVLAGLQKLGVAADAVDYIFLTHIHLDHAGAAGALLRELPNARLTVHPRGLRHMVNPAQLSAAVGAVYGADNARRIYGEILPCPPERIVTTADGTVLEFGGRELLFLDTPGHARHHVCIRDSQSGCFFTGDTGGLIYRELAIDGVDRAFPTLTPSQLEPLALHDSLNRIMSFSPPGFFATHYGLATDTPRLAADLHRLINAHEEIALNLSDLAAGENRKLRIEEDLAELTRREAREQSWPLSPEAAVELLAQDLELNAQGLEHWLASGAKG